MKRGIVLGLLLAVAARMAATRLWARWRAFGEVGEMKGKSYW